MNHLKNLKNLNRILNNDGIKKFKEYGALFHQVSNMNHILCRAYGIEGYTINLDGSIDIRDEENNNRYRNSGFRLNIMKFKHARFEVGFETNDTIKIPVKFNRVEYNFCCSGCNLESLENSPKYVRGNFDCSNNNLTTLLGGPSIITGDYICFNNNLKDMYGFPEAFNGELKIQKSYQIGLKDNPICEIVQMSHHEGSKIRFVKSLNYNQVIRNGDTIIEDRLKEALEDVGIKWDVVKLYNDFKYYKVV